MNSSIDGAAFVVGTLALCGFAVVGVVTVGTLSFLGALTLRNQLEKVEAADTLIELERQKSELEGLVK